MKLEEIQDLIKFVAKSGVNEVEIEQENFKIVIKTDSDKKKKGEQAVQYIQMPQQAAPMMQQAPAPVAAPAPAAAPVAPAAPAAPAAEESKYITIKSPMIGTFYRSPAPDKPAFVNVGDVIKPGQVICIIEAMKLFNEIESEVSGKVIKVLTDDMNPAEYDQPLFLIDPS